MKSQDIEKFLHRPTQPATAKNIFKSKFPFESKIDHFNFMRSFKFYYKRSKIGYMVKYYAVLIRGINVGGKNSIPMSQLKICLEKLGFSDVTTYIASGNIIVKSEKNANQIKTLLEEALPQHFKLTNNLIKVLVLSKRQLQSVVLKKPKGFGEQPEKYHSDIIFLIGISSAHALKVFNPKEGVDEIWEGRGVIYSQRESVLRTKSRLKQIMSTPEYTCMTIRNWNTTAKLAQLLENRR